MRGGFEGRAVEQARSVKIPQLTSAKRAKLVRIALKIVMGVLSPRTPCVTLLRHVWRSNPPTLEQTGCLARASVTLMQLPLMPRGMPARAWPPVLATRGPGGPCEWHSHHSLRFALALEGEVRIRTARQGKWSSAAGVLTAPDAAHVLDAQGAQLLLVFLDPESAAGTSFHAALSGGPVRLISDAERTAMTRDVVPRTILHSGAAAWALQAAETLRIPTPAAPRSVHPRVRALLSMLRNGGVGDATSLEVLASAVGLSPSRLMHVFTSSVGIPLRPYLAWLRVQRAAIDIVSGNSLTDAALAAGFSDAAHMSRTFRRMLGIPPSLLRAMQCST